MRVEKETHVAPKQAANAVNTPDDDETEIDRDDTELEVAIAKAEHRISKMPHIDAKVLAKDYLFPLLRKLAKSSGDVDVQIEDLAEALENFDGDDVVDTLEEARDMIFELSKALDETAVLAGFFTVTPEGLKVTERAPANFQAFLTALGSKVHGVVTNIQGAIEAAEQDDEDEDEDEDTTPPALKPDGISNEPGPTHPQVAAVPSVPTIADAIIVAAETDAETAPARGATDAT